MNNFKYINEFLNIIKLQKIVKYNNILQILKKNVYLNTIKTKKFILQEKILCKKFKRLKITKKCKKCDIIENINIKIDYNNNKYCFLCFYDNLNFYIKTKLY